MSLDKYFFDRPTNITAKVVCDSISEQGIRLTTFEIEYPRFIHGEMMTHRSLSKNSSSSRAIPIQKMLEQIESNMAVPVYWGKTKSGMQATEEVCSTMQKYACERWGYAYLDAKHYTEQLADGNLHKQVPNRLTEPFQMMKVVVTGTDWDNFFNLRIHPDAQPEICMLAYKMFQAMQDSSPNPLRTGEWHFPFVEISQNQHDLNDTYYFVWDKDVSGTETDGYKYEQRVTLEEATKISAASCASVSYRTEGMTLEKADKIFDMLIKAEVVHSSPFEHLATPVKPKFNEVGLVRVNCSEPQSWEDGVTHTTKQGHLCSGNLRGWVQYRHLLPNNTNWEFDFEERMKLFED